MSNSAQHKLSYLLEAIYGTTPAAGAFKLLPHTGTTLGLAKGSIEAQTIRPDRQVEDVRHGNRQVGGDINTEFRWLDYDPLLEAVFCGTWTGDLLKPAAVRRSYSILREFTDQVAAGDVMPFQLFKGCEFNTMTLSMAPESLVLMNFGVFGREYTNSLTRPAASTEVAASANKPFDSFRGAISVDSIAVAQVTELTFTLENGIEPRFVLFSDKTNQPKMGRTRISGSMTLYFENASMLNAFNGEVLKTLSFTLTDLAGLDYVFSFPRLVLGGGQADVDGESDITMSMPFTATFDSVTNNAMSIVRQP